MRAVLFSAAAIVALLFGGAFGQICEDTSPDCRNPTPQQCTERFFRESCSLSCGTCEPQPCENRRSDCSSFGKRMCFRDEEFRNDCQKYCQQCPCEDEDLCGDLNSQKCKKKKFQKKCPVSCDTCPCEDLHQSCSRFNRDNCRTRWFAKACPEFCDLCPPCKDEDYCVNVDERKCLDTTVREDCPMLCKDCKCEDLQPWCVFVSDFLCKKFPSTATWCPETCGHCDPPCEDEEPFCNGLSVQRCMTEEVRDRCPVLCDTCPCEDKYPDWCATISEGQCRNPFIRQLCRETCGDCPCIDEPECLVIPPGKCEGNEPLLEKCPVLCSQCECVDHVPWCSLIPESNCKRDPEFAVLCPKYCDVCPPCVDYDRRCSGVNEEDCERPEVQAICPLSCNLCCDENIECPRERPILNPEDCKCYVCLNDITDPGVDTPDTGCSGFLPFCDAPAGEYGTECLGIGCELGDIDICFAIDQSGSVCGAPYDSELAFVTNFVVAVDLAKGSSTVTYSGLEFSSGPGGISLINMGVPTENAVAFTGFVGALTCDGGGTAFIPPLKKCVEILNSIHPDHKKLLVLLTDGSSLENEDLVVEVAEAFTDGEPDHYIVTVGAGSGVDTALLTDIATPSSLAFFPTLATDFDEIVEEVLDSLCDEVEP